MRITFVTLLEMLIAHYSPIAPTILQWQKTSAVKSLKSGKILY